MTDGDIQRQQQALSDQLKKTTSHQLQKAIRETQIAAARQGHNLSWQQARAEVQQQREDSAAAATQALQNAVPNFAKDPSGFLGAPQSMVPPKAPEPVVVKPAEQVNFFPETGVPIQTASINLGGTGTDPGGSYAFVLVEGQAPIARRLLTTGAGFVDLTQSDTDIEIAIRPADDDHDYFLKSSGSTISWDGPPDGNSYVIVASSSSLSWVGPPASGDYVLSASDGEISWSDGGSGTGVPDPPTSGDYVLTSTDGVMTWTELGSCPTC